MGKRSEFIAAVARGNPTAFSPAERYRLEANKYSDAEARDSGGKWSSGSSAESDLNGAADAMHAAGLKVYLDRLGGGTLSDSVIPAAVPGTPELGRYRSLSGHYEPATPGRPAGQQDPRISNLQAWSRKDNPDGTRSMMVAVRGGEHGLYSGSSPREDDYDHPELHLNQSAAASMGSRIGSVLSSAGMNLVGSPTLNSYDTGFGSRDVHYAVTYTPGEAKLSKGKRLEKYDDSEARDSDGKWSGGGGSSTPKVPTGYSAQVGRDGAEIYHDNGDGDGRSHLAGTIQAPSNAEPNHIPALVEGGHVTSFRTTQQAVDHIVAQHEALHDPTNPPGPRASFWTRGGGKMSKKTERAAFAASIAREAPTTFTPKERLKVLAKDPVQKYSPDQARDDRGEWSVSGGDASSSNTQPAMTRGPVSVSAERGSTNMRVVSLNGKRIGTTERVPGGPLPRIVSTVRGENVEHPHFYSDHGGEHGAFNAAVAHLVGAASPAGKPVPSVFSVGSVPAANFNRNQVLAAAVDASALPTADPHIAGLLWNSSATIKESAG